MRTEDSSPGPRGQPAAFATTHWSVVLAAGDATSPSTAEALGQLCRLCWYPLYVYVRRRGYSVEDAQDLTQQFFAHVLEKGCFGRADPARGRFRCFLLQCLQNFLNNEWRRSQRTKRGGGALPLSLDATGAEGRYAHEPAVAHSPEHAYERRWALTLLEEVLTSLRQEYERADQAPLFAELSDLLWGKDVPTSYAAIGSRLGMTEGALRSAMHRLRRRYRERLRAQVAHTLTDPMEVDDELRHLVEILGRPAPIPPND